MSPFALSITYVILESDGTPCSAFLHLMVLFAREGSALENLRPVRVSIGKKSKA